MHVLQCTFRFALISVTLCKHIAYIYVKIIELLWLRVIAPHNEILKQFIVHTPR